MHSGCWRLFEWFEWHIFSSFLVVFIAFYFCVNQLFLMINQPSLFGIPNKIKSINQETRMKLQKWTPLTFSLFENQSSTLQFAFFDSNQINQLRNGQSLLFLLLVFTLYLITHWPERLSNAFYVGIVATAWNQIKETSILAPINVFHEYGIWLCYVNMCVLVYLCACVHACACVCLLMCIQMYNLDTWWSMCIRRLSKI